MIKWRDRLNNEFIEGINQIKFKRSEKVRMRRIVKDSFWSLSHGINAKPE